MKNGVEKEVNNAYPVDWINPKCENQNCNNMINADIFMGTLFIQTKVRLN